MYAVLFAFAILAFILIPLAPTLVRFRIRVHRWLGWNWASDLLERNFDTGVLIFRLILFVVAALLFYLGWEDLAD